MKNTLLIACSILLISAGCSSDIAEPKKEKLMKSWQLVSMEKNDLPMTLEECQKGELIFFTEKNVCYLFFPCDSTDLRSAWNFDNKTEILNISDFLPITYYVQTLDAENLKIKYYDYSSTGELDKYIKQYKSVQTTLEAGKLRLKQ